MGQGHQFSDTKLLWLPFSQLTFSLTLFSFPCSSLAAGLAIAGTGQQGAISGTGCLSARTGKMCPSRMP